MIIPQHGWMYVKLLGWYQQLKSETVDLTEQLPSPGDVIRVEVVVIDPEPAEDERHKYYGGDVVMTRFMQFVSTDVEVSQVDLKTTTAFGLIRACDVMAIIEDGEGGVN